MPDTHPATAAASVVPDAVVPERILAISDSAARRVAFLIQNDGRPGLMLRLSVSGGGCSGFQYGFTFDDTVTADDHIFEHLGIKLVTDDCSLDLLAGATLDYVEDLMGAAFTVRNPNATASCGCGSSFAV
jgi:iron-sulfur cluster insertion protein